MRFMMVIGLRWLICAGFVVSISACGQKGDLYVPAEQQTEKKKKALLDRPSDLPLVDYGRNYDKSGHQDWVRVVLRVSPPAHVIGGEHDA